MTIEGSLRTMPAEDVLRWIRRRDLAGRLAVRRDAVLRTFEVDGSQVTWVSSNRPGDVLSQVLRSRGIIDEADLERAATAEVASGAMLGMALVESGVMTEEAVRAVLDSQIREATLDVLSWNRGGFRFVPARSDRRARLTVGVSIDELLALAEGLVENWRRLRTAVSTPSTRFWIKEDAPDGEELDDETRARRRWLMEAIAEDTTFADLIAGASAERFVTLSDLSALIGAQLIGAVPEAPGGGLTAAAIELAAAARASLADEDFIIAYDLARQALSSDPTPTLEALVAQCQRALVGHLSRTLLGSHRIPRRLVADDELEKLDLSEGDRYALDRIDGVWDLFSLVTSSNRGEVEALVTYKQLDERGLIAL